MACQELMGPGHALLTGSLSVLAMGKCNDLGDAKSKALMRRTPNRRSSFVQS